MKQMIDIVLPWVDGSDPAWREEYERYRLKEKPFEDANSEIRYQDLGLLRYWFRAVEKNMPWVNRIFFITYGHLPDFLNLSHEKLCIVKHEDFIPREYLPVFSINPIELNVHRIDALSENYIYFNDDVFPILPIDESYYFVDNTVCDEAVESPIMPVDIGRISAWSCWMKSNDILVINRNFKKRDVQRKYYEKWFSNKYEDLLERNNRLSYWDNFCGFHDPHMANAFYKRTLIEIWNKEPDVMRQTSANRFRKDTDVNQYLIRYWQLCKGDFIPRKTKGKSYLVSAENCRQVADDIRSRRYQMISLNEDCPAGDFPMISKKLQNAFDEILPSKSSFEI